MTRAMVAVLKSQVASLAAKLKLSDDELVSLGVALAVTHFKEAGLDRAGLHAVLDGALEVPSGDTAAED